MAKKNVPPLLLEELQDRANMLYLSMIEYKRENYLAIIDNVRGSDISAFVLDYAEAENVDVNWLLSVSNIWYYKSSHTYPLSFELAKQGMLEKTAPLLKTFSMDYVSRLIGKIFIYDVDKKPKVKRKRVNVIQAGIEVSLKKPSKTIITLDD